MNEPQTASEAESDWPGNYFNYFTEIEEHFQRARGSGLFLLSPLDWALIENWREAGIPLNAALKGIDEAFEKWRSRKQKRRLVNSLAYCAQAVMESAQRAPAEDSRGRATQDAPFTASELCSYLSHAANVIREKPGPVFSDIAGALDACAQQAEEHVKNLEDLERRLTALEEKLVAAIRTLQTDDELYGMREKLDRELKPYRGKMTADQLSMLERRYLDTALLDYAKLPRLSLFYLH